MLRLDQGVLKSLVEERFGGRIADITSPMVWPVRPSPNRTTIWRWLNGKKFPRDADELCGLAGALDVDPIALVGLRPGLTFSELCTEISNQAWSLGLPPALRALRFLQIMLPAKPDWPSQDFALKYFHRDWVRREHRHRASLRRDYYGAFLIKAETSLVHQVWHFAWRNPTKTNWRPYGLVRVEKSQIHLFGFEGIESTARFGVADQDAFIVETWFGRGDADFCIASLHGFSVAFGEPPNLQLPIVRFTVDHRATLMA